MRVTDEMVRRLSDHLKQKVFYGTLNNEARDTKAREFLEVALSHAAGQEGEQCRAASVPEDIETLLDEVVIAARDDERCNDHGNLQSARRRAHDSLQDAKAQLLRALSRGVPEGNQAAVDSVIRQYCRTCGGCGEIGGHSGQTPESYEEWSAPCPDCSPAAIAAQRKEG